MILKICLDESWVDRIKREHPWRWRKAVLRDRLEYFWTWIVDGPVWDFSTDEPNLIGARTGRPIDYQEDDEDEDLA